MDKLDEICAAKRRHIERAQAGAPLDVLLRRAAEAGKPRGFTQALRAKAAAGEYALIAEIKKASPSKGLIRADFNPAQLAEAYAQGGAACLSVLTDTPYFQGCDDYLTQARNAVALPVLRKDFMLDPYQIAESRALGADAVLLIMAALSDAQARELEDAAHALGMDALIEVHDERELERALACLRSPLIGINNRNLKTLEVDLTTAETLARSLPEHVLGVGESGIGAHTDLLRLKRAGIFCFLVGESLMRQRDVATATRQLLGGTHA